MESSFDPICTMYIHYVVRSLGSPEKEAVSNAMDDVGHRAIGLVRVHSAEI